MRVRVIDYDNSDFYVDISQELYDKLAMLQEQHGYIARAGDSPERQELLHAPRLSPEELPELIWYQ